jgi:hypothetical protein
VKVLVPGAYLRLFLGAQAGYHAFRHFNTSLMDDLGVPLKTIQERLDHALTGVFTLDIYGGKPNWERNIEAAHMIGAEIERAVLLAEARPRQERERNLAVSSGYSDGLTSVNENDSGELRLLSH